MSTAALSLAQPFTIIGAGEMTSGGDSKFFDAPGRVLAGRAAGNTWQIYAGTIVNGGTPDANFHVLYARSSPAASSRLRIDGVQVAADNVGAATLNGLTTVGNDPGYSTITAGDFGRLIIYAAFSDADELKIEAFLKAFWGTP